MGFNNIFHPCPAKSTIAGLCLIYEKFRTLNNLYPINFLNTFLKEGSFKITLFTINFFLISLYTF